MTSTIALVGLSAWLGFVAAGLVWFVWGIVQGITGWITGGPERRVADTEPAQQETP